MEAGDIYRGARPRVVELVSSLGDKEVATVSPGTPLWTVKDIVGHLTGVPADILAAALADRPAGHRALVATGMGVGMFGIGLFWIIEFQAFGFVALLVLETGFVVLAAIATPRVWVLPAALVLGEAARGAWPFGGLPLGGAALGQAGGPLAPAVRIGGPLLLLGLIVAAGTAACASMIVTPTGVRGRSPRRAAMAGVRPPARAPIGWISSDSLSATRCSSRGSSARRNSREG